MATFSLIEFDIPSGVEIFKVVHRESDVLPATVIERTKQWISDFVIELNLCPFARRPFEANLIGYAVSNARDPVSLTSELLRELRNLAEKPRAEIETSFLIVTEMFVDFLDFNDYLVTANTDLADAGYEGVFQIASFHPRYQFAGTEVDDVENDTNRSPFPMLHLLREDSISDVSHDPAFLEQIPVRNIQMLRERGKKP